MLYDKNLSQPKDVVLAYIDNMWNKSDPEACRPYLADTQWRHDPKNPSGDLVEAHSMEANIERAKQGFTLSSRQNYTPVVVTAEGDDVSVVWEAILHDVDPAVAKQFGFSLRDDNSMLISGIELFRVRDGKIAEIWNAYGPNLMGWGETKVK